MSLNRAADPSVGECNGVTYSSTEALLACFAALANKVDLEPRDMVVGAPSSVIASTMTETPNPVAPETPVRRVQEVNNWRPNTQAWLDAKARNAGSSGLTTADIDATARWAPKIGKAARVVGGAAGWVGGTLTALDLAWTVSNNTLVPTLGLSREGMDYNFCTRRSMNVFLDMLGGLAGADCADWRLRLDDEAAQFQSVTFVGSPAGYSYLGTVRGGTGDYYWVHCYVGGSGSGVSSGYRLEAAMGGGLWGALVSSTLVPRDNSYFRAQSDRCKWEYPTFTHFNPNSPPKNDPRLRVVRDSDNKVVEEMTEEVAYKPGHWTSTAKCLDGRSVVESSGAWLMKAGGEVSMPPVLTPPANCEPVEVETALTDQDGNTIGTPARTTVPTEVQDWMRDFPSCWDGSCRLILKKVVGTGEIDCFDAPEQCVDWFTEVKTQPSTYKCYYAGQLMPIVECNVYARVFDRSKVQQGTGYADPETGEEPKTGTGTTTTTNPGAAKVAMETPVGDPEGTRECWPTGWGVFNPFEWVLQPVKCALEWAFVPRTSKLTETATKVQLAASNSQIGRATEVASTWAAVAEGMNPSGCAGPTISLDLMGIQYSGQPLSACSEPGATLAFWCRIIIGIAAVLAAVFAVTRYIGRVFGFEGFGRAPGGDT